ncbi:unnamed protein product [Oncorhynchus mykiss]|uniref:ubiquitinyl hydrolase 1 n=1 Tax=Oncorhynchus mykiss TaxID=8022 RepID=A0A060XJ06_ONCMY|nr:unnamed protein product [Oncorhynchus mykiss]
MYSFKINSHVAFPLEGLELRPFLAKDSPSQITTYDLLSVICHHGTAGSGHYIAYCQNVINGQWYEFDDQYVTEVHETVVQNAEAYVLFYRKSSEESVRERQKVVDLANMKEPSLLQFYISREWLNKFNTFTEPGPISNHTFLCQHGGIPPNKYHYIDDLVVILPQNVWEYLYNSFGGGPAVNHLYVCAICQVELEALAKRRKVEIDTFIRAVVLGFHMTGQGCSHGWGREGIGPPTGEPAQPIRMSFSSQKGFITDRNIPPFPGGWFQTIQQVKKLDVEVLGWRGYSWSAG